MSQQQVKPTQEFFIYLNEFVQEEIASEIQSESKIEFWTKMKTELEVAGYTQEIIGRTMKNAIEEKLWKTKYEQLGVPREEFKWHSGHFYSWCRREHITNIFNKTKSPEQDTSINTPVLQRLNTLREIVDIAIKKYLEIPNVDSKITDEEFQDWDTNLSILADCFNEKLKVPMNTEHLLLFRAATESSVTYAATAFLEDRVKMMKAFKKLVTGKQINYFQTNEIKYQLPILKPKTRDEAIFQKYYGIQCEQCKSWRVKELTDTMENGNNLTCKDCQNTFKGYTVNKCRYCQIPFFKEELKHVVKTWQIDDAEYPKGDKSGGHCPECNTLNHLPQSLIDLVS